MGVNIISQLGAADLSGKRVPEPTCGETDGQTAPKELFITVHCIIGYAQVDEYSGVKKRDWNQILKYQIFLLKECFFVVAMALL